MVQLSASLCLALAAGFSIGRGRLAHLKHCGPSSLEQLPSPSYSAASRLYHCCIQSAHPQHLSAITCASKIARAWPAAANSSNSLSNGRATASPLLVLLAPCFTCHRIASPILSYGSIQFQAIESPSNAANYVTANGWAT